MKKNIFTTSFGVTIAGIIIGSFAALLSVFGNPANMGLCIACFTRDTAGALGFHRASTLQYIRPELIGIILGGFLSAVIKKEYKPQGGSSPIIRFFLGVFSMIGALVFLGCPWRTLLRVSGGDVNALFGIVGIIIGSGIGVLFWRMNYSLGSQKDVHKSIGFIHVIVSIFLLILLITKPIFSENGVVFFSQTGPGSMHAPVIIALIISFIIGIVAQRSRFCTIGGIRDSIFNKDFHMMKGIIGFILAAMLVNILTGRFHISMVNQPIAHTNIVWNILSMVLASLAFTLGFGCPGRQLILSAEGNTDAFIFVIGMFTGAALSHNFNLASSVSGPTIYGMYAVVIGIVLCVLLGFVMSSKKEA